MLDLKVIEYGVSRLSIGLYLNCSLKMVKHIDDSDLIIASRVNSGTFTMTKTGKETDCVDMLCGLCLNNHQYFGTLVIDHTRGVNVYIPNRNIATMIVYDGSYYQALSQDMEIY